MNSYMRHVPSSVKTAFLTILFLFLFLYIFARLFGPIPFSVNSITTMKSDLFTVSGEGEASAAPDTAMITLGITQTETTVELAKNKANEVINKITTDLKNTGIAEKDIKTVNYNVYPNREYSGRNDISGYTVSQDLQIKVKDFAKANKAVDLATADGANQVGGITFVLDDSKREQLEAEARKQAIEKAKTKAQSIANAAGIKLGRIINVQEFGNPQSIMYEKAEMMTGGDTANQSTNLQPGENTVHISVTLSYETY